MLTAKERSVAIFRSIYFGILPSWFYEKKCHYAKHGEGEGAYTYWEHLKLNMYIVKALICKTEHPCTHKFHKTKNVKYFRWQYK